MFLGCIRKIAPARCVIVALTLVTAVPVLAAPPGAGWSKVFQDNFDGTKLDGHLWSKNYAQAPYIYLDHQASMSPDQVKESGGFLFLTAVHAHNPNAPQSFVSGSQTIPLDYTSGAVNTKGKFSLSGHGHDAYVEARIQMPSSIGSWPAFWLMPESGGWPPEIDIMEMPMPKVVDRKRVQYHYHYGANGATQKFLGNVFTSTADFSAGYHNFGVAWSEDSMAWYVDDKLIGQISDANIGQAQAMYIILNLGVGGWAGTPPRDSAWPAKMRVDWVRAYQRKTSTRSISKSVSTDESKPSQLFQLPAEWFDTSSLSSLRIRSAVDDDPQSWRKLTQN